MSIPEVDREPQWDDEENLAIASQPATFVYMNPARQVVIRQRNEVVEDDPFVVLSREHLPVLIAALQMMLAELAAEPEPRIQAEAARRPPQTAAERQRRRRERQRDSRDSCDGQRDSRDSPRSR